MKKPGMLGCAVGLVLLLGCAAPVDVAAPASATRVPEATRAATPRPMPTQTLPILAGRLRYGGEGVAGGEARLYPVGWAEDGAEPVARATADEAGSFAFSALPPGEWVLVGAFADGDLDAGGWLPVIVDAEAHALPEAVIDLQRPLAVAEPALDDTVSSTPTLRWAPVAGATGFALQVIDAGTTALAFDLAAQLAPEPEQLEVLPPLTPGHAYTWNVKLLDAQGAELAYGGGSFTVEGTALVALPEPSPLDGLPPSCHDGSGSRAAYADVEGHYCFLYPLAFVVDVNDAGQPLVMGPALDDSAEPLRATLAIEVSEAPQGQTLAQIAANLIAASAAPGLAMEATPISLSGVPAVLVAPMPGLPTGQMVLTIADGRLYQLRFAPLASQWPEAAEQVETLYSSVTGSLTFLQ